jgi:hypothetical protein
MRRVAAIILLLLVAGTARADLTDAQREAVLAEAQQAYDDGVGLLRRDPGRARESFTTSAERFGQLVDDGVVNGALLYNLGNASLQAGDVGAAILRYRQAEAYIPGDGRLAHNLEYARSLRRTQIAPSGRRALAAALLQWHDRTALGVRYAIFAAAYLAFWVLLLVDRSRPMPLMRWLAGVLAVIWLAVGASVGADLLADDRERAGVVLDDDVIVRKGNGEGFEPQFEEPIHQGVEFELLDRRPGWLRIELADGNTGWIPESTAGLL